MQSQDPRALELGDLRTALCLWPHGEPATISLHGARSPLPFLVLLPSMTRTHTGLQASLGNGRSFATWRPGQSIVGQACVDGCWPCGGSDAGWSSMGPGSRHPWGPLGVEGGAHSMAIVSHSCTSQGRCSSQNEAALGLSPSEPL